MNEFFTEEGSVLVNCSTDDEGYLIAKKLIAVAVELTQGTPAHKEIWDSCKGEIRQLWNYYPRGRVEIRRGRVIVYANPVCFAWDGLCETLRAAFSLGVLPMEMKADGSMHYTEGVFGKYRLRCK